MKATPDTKTALGLDIGTSRIVTARHSETAIQYKMQLNAFVAIPFSRMTENVLSKENIPYSIEGSQILVYGNESEKFADSLNQDVRRTMKRGFLNPAEPESARMINRIVSAIAGPAERSQSLCFSVPAAPLGAGEDLTYHDAILKQMFTDLGYKVTSINEGLAVVYGELESTNYTGIGISCGGGLCNVCLSYLSVPILSFSIPKAGDFIDASAASVAGVRANRIRMVKEQSFFMNGHFENKLQQVLSVYYDDVIQSLVSGMRTAFQNAENLPKLPRPIPIILSGGTAVPKGFCERFEKLFRSEAFPLEISEVRMASEPLTTTARGALMAAVSEN